MFTFENAYRIFRGRQKRLNGFEDGTFPIKKKLTQRIKHFRFSSRNYDV